MVMSIDSKSRDIKKDMLCTWPWRYTLPPNFNAALVSLAHFLTRKEICNCPNILPNYPVLCLTLHTYRAACTWRGFDHPGDALGKVEGNSLGNVEGDALDDVEGNMP